MANLQTCKHTPLTINCASKVTQKNSSIAGIDWVAGEAKNSAKPAVVSMSFGGYPSNSLDQTIRAVGANSMVLHDAGNTENANALSHLQLYLAGITVVVASGNESKDASNISPARVGEAITVGASTFKDTMADFSNFGAPVDIFAPGTNVTSTWNDGESSVLSGTSMATPHVSGYVAYLLSIDGSLSPANVASVIDEGALSGVLGQIREYP